MMLLNEFSSPAQHEVINLEEEIPLMIIKINIESIVIKDCPSCLYFHPKSFDSGFIFRNLYLVKDRTLEEIAKEEWNYQI